MHLRECGEKMPPQIAWSYRREEAALIIERVIYCPGSPDCSGSLLSLSGFPFPPSPERHPHKPRRLSWIKKEKGKCLSRLPLSLRPTPPHRTVGPEPRPARGSGSGRAGSGLPAGFPCSPISKRGGERRGREERAAPSLGSLGAVTSLLRLPWLGNHRGRTTLWSAAPVPVRCGARLHLTLSRIQCTSGLENWYGWLRCLFCSFPP